MAEIFSSESGKKCKFHRKIQEWLAQPRIKESGEQRPVLFFFVIFNPRSGKSSHRKSKTYFQAINKLISSNLHQTLIAMTNPIPPNCYKHKSQQTKKCRSFQLTTQHIIPQNHQQIKQNFSSKLSKIPIPYARSRKRSISKFTRAN